MDTSNGGCAVIVYRGDLVEKSRPDCCNSPDGKAQKKYTYSNFIRKERFVKMNVYVGVLGEDRGKIIEMDADAISYAMETLGIGPLNGYENVNKEFLNELLTWFYSGNWEIYHDIPSDKAIEMWPLDDAC